MIANYEPEDEDPFKQLDRILTMMLISIIAGVSITAIILYVLIPH